MIRTFGLTQLIEEPTRTTDKTSTLLDHILVNTPSKVVQSGVLGKCISDHDIMLQGSTRSPNQASILQLVSDL